jgi:hypothetical protein
VGINLWLTALRNSPPLPSQPHKYFDLLEQLVSMLSQNFDLLGSITGLLVSYFVSNATFVLQVWNYRYHFRRMSLTKLFTFQRCAVPLFEAYKPPLTQSVTVNVGGLINSIALAIELAPSAAWGEPLHVSGLFRVLVDHLAEDEVNHRFLSLGGGDPRLTGFCSYRPLPLWSISCYFPGSL